MPWVGLSWGQEYARGFGGGKHTEKHDKERNSDTQVRGSCKEIKPLLRLYYLIYGSMDGTTMVLLELSA
jgi:hypothetical protein